MWGESRAHHRRHNQGKSKGDMTCVYDNSDPGLEVPLSATVILSLNLFFLGT